MQSYFDKRITHKTKKKLNFFHSDLLNENEIYSCNQLEAYNSLPSSEKLKLQQKNIEQSTDQLDKVKLEIDVTGHSQIEANQLPENYNKNQQLIISATVKSSNTVAVAAAAATVDHKSNPKTVTASVFKALPIGSKLFKGNGGTDSIATPSNQIVGARAPQSVTASLIQPISSIKRDLNVRVHKINKPIAEPSFVPRQTVVTASLFQPRATAPGIPIKPFNNTETMNKSYLMFTNDFRQLTSEYPGFIHKKSFCFFFFV